MREGLGEGIFSAQSTPFEWFNAHSHSPREMAVVRVAISSPSPGERAGVRVFQNFLSF